MSDVVVEKVVWIKPGEGIAASGKIPEHSEFFQDHFPEFPVLPGVLAIEVLKQTAEAYLREVHKNQEEHFYLKHIRGTKFHLYLKPGDEWESEVLLTESKGQETHWKARLIHQGKTAVSARLVLAPSHTDKKIVAS